MLQKQIDDWINYLAVRGLSGETRRAYQWHVRKFVEWRLLKRASSYTLSHMLKYLAERVDGGWSDSSRKLAVNAMRSFFSFAVGDKSPASRLPIPRPKTKLQRTLTAAQAFAVLSSCDTSTGRGLRDLALLCLFLDTGLRASEICRLETAEVNFTERNLQTIVKGGSVGRGRFSEYTAMQLSAWLGVRAQVAKPGVSTLFVSVGGLTPGATLTPRGLRIIMKKVGAAAGLEKFSPHDLRRTFATLAIRFGAPTRVVQVAGRWDDLQMLERYTAALQADDIDPYLPVTRLMAM